jgi:ABC-type antimicrobial peptide transport system permease subunit
LGSTVRGIITLFIKEFLIIIFIAGLVASPIAYLLMNHWLKAYAYRIDLTLMPFLMAIGTLVLLTALLISIQTFRAANANPIKSLRTE